MRALPRDQNGTPTRSKEIGGHCLGLWFFGIIRLRGKVEITAIETVRKRDFGLSSQLADYWPPFIKPHVDDKIQRTGIAARCCTTVRRVKQLENWSSVRSAP